MAGLGAAGAAAGLALVIAGSPLASLGAPGGPWGNRGASLATCFAEGPTDTTAPAVTPSGTGTYGPTLPLSEGTWTVISGACGTRIVSVTYDWYRDSTWTGSGGTFPGSSGGTTQYTPQSADVGHLLTAQVTACDNQNYCTTVTASPSGAKVGNNTSCGSDTTCACSSNTTWSTMQADTEAAHSTWVRIAIPWSLFEPGQNSYDDNPNNPGSYASALASCIQTLHAEGKSVLIDFLNTPNWAQASTTDQWNYPPDNSVTCPNESCYGTAAARLVSDLANNYTNARIDALEVWNEEDKPAFWDPAVNDATQREHDYEQLLAGAYSALRGLTTVVLGGTESIDEPWHEALLNAGYGSDFDVLGIHTYPYYHNVTDIPAIMDGSTSSPPNTLNQVVKDMNNHGLTSTPLWITEMGADAGASGWPTDAQTAQMLTDFYNYIRGNSVWDANAGIWKTCPSTECNRVKLGFWFTDYLSSTDRGWAMLDLNLNPKPEYNAFVALP